MQVYKLKEARLYAGKSQKDAAELLETTQAQISKYEVGKQDITLSRLVMLADFYEVSIDWIAGRSNSPEVHDPVSNSDIT